MISTNISAMAPFAQKPAITGIGRRLTTTKTYPILYRQITKCGCTFINALLRHLDGQPSDSGENISADYFSDQQVHDTDAKFIVIRNPIDRFTSLYFDKAIGPENPIGTHLQRIGVIDANAGNNIELHQENCLRLLWHIRKTFDSKSKRKPNWHWRPQSFRLKQVYPYGFHVLTLDGLIWQLPELLCDVVPNIEQAMYDVPLKNVSQKVVAPEDIMVDELVGELMDIYPLDFQVFEEVSAYWTHAKG